MITGKPPAAPQLSRFIVGALVAGLAACDSTGTPDAAVYIRLFDGAVLPDAVVQPDVIVAPDGPRPDVAPTDVGDVPRTDIGDAAPTDAGDAPPGDVPADVPPAPMLTRVVIDCGEVCTRPLDAIPNAAGTAIFFTGFTQMGVAAVFRATVPAAGMPAVTPTVVAMGNGLEFPLGIALSNDDNTIYVADQSADRAMDQPGIGAIFSVSATGGTLSVVAVGVDLVQPSGVSVSIDGNDLLITGTQRNDMGQRRGLFRVPRGGGVTSVVTTDLVDPSGVSQVSAGTILCFDVRRGGARSGTAVNVMGSAVTDFTPALAANYPAGVAIAMDGHSALLSGADPAGGGGLLTVVDAMGHPTSPAAVSMGMATPLGLHRARSADVWAVADESAGGNGQIFLVSLPH